MSNPFDVVLGWFRRDAAHYVDAFFDPADGDGLRGEQGPVVAGRDYFRLWLEEMWLAQDRDWFTDWHPAVQSHVRIEAGGGEPIDIPRLVSPLDLMDKPDRKARGPVISKGRPLTALMPFNGGTVTLQAGLLAIKGRDDVATLIKVLGGFADLLAVPQLSAVTRIAGPVNDGIRELLGLGDENLALGFDETLASEVPEGSRGFRAGHVGIVLAEASEGRGLSVVDRRLHKDGARLEGVSYLLFGVEKRSARDDWEELPEIVEPLNKAIAALGVGAAEQADTMRRAAIVAANVSRELTTADRRRVVQAINDRYQEVGGGLGAVEVEGAQFGELVEGTMSPDQALALGPPSLEEAVT